MSDARGRKWFAWLSLDCGSLGRGLLGSFPSFLRLQFPASEAPLLPHEFLCFPRVQRWGGPQVVVKTGGCTALPHTYFDQPREPPVWSLPHALHQGHSEMLVPGLG